MQPKSGHRAHITVHVARDFKMPLQFFQILRWFCFVLLSHFLKHSSKDVAIAYEISKNTLHYECLQSLLPIALDLLLPSRCWWFDGGIVLHNPSFPSCTLPSRLSNSRSQLLLLHGVTFLFSSSVYIHH